jgi:hypothetical protein
VDHGNWICCDNGSIWVLSIQGKPKVCGFTGGVKGKSRVCDSNTCVLLPCGYVALRAVLKVSLRYVALALVYCLPCEYMALQAVLKVSLGYVALALVYCCPAGMWI